MQNLGDLGASGAG